MAGNNEDFVQCPTRSEAEASLISPQIIPRSTCCKRQSEHFHKCHKCIFRSEFVEAHFGELALARA